MNEYNRTNPFRWIAPAFPTNGTYSFDPEVGWIDGMETELPRPVPILTTPEAFKSCDDELARIRVEIQVATQHCNAAYFANLETLVRGIGQLRRDRAVTWCSFGALTDDLGRQAWEVSPYPIVLLDRRLDTLAVLYTWLCGLATGHSVFVPSHPKCTYGEREEWIWMALGEPTPNKRWLVGHLCRVIKQGLRHPWLDQQHGSTLRYPLYVPFHVGVAATPNDDDVLRTVGERLDLGAHESDLLRMMDRLEDQPCHFRFDRWIDNLIAAIGQPGAKAPHAPPDEASSVQTRITQMRTWVRAINAWIDDEPLLAISAKWDTVAPVARRVYAMLGEPSTLKVWLTASLSKTIRGFGDTIRPQDEAPPQRFLIRHAAQANTT